MTAFVMKEIGAVATGLCPGGRLRMDRRAFEVADEKPEDVIKLLVTF